MSDGRFPTSNEVFNRIKWDPGIDETLYVIGYQERSGAVQEKPFAQWNPKGDIPWHRVVYVREGSVVVWDRQARVDLIVNPPQGVDPREGRVASEAASAEGDAPSAEALLLDALPTWRFDAARGVWRAHDDEAPLEAVGAPPARLRVLTWNVLFSTHRSQAVDVSGRVAAIVEALEREEAELIALQEVTPALLDALLASPWVRARCWVSEGPTHQSVTPHGQVLLSRLPMRCAWHKPSPKKMILMARVRVGALEVVVPVIHLTSDRAKDSEAKRAAQLDVLRTLTARADHALILGDWNLRDDAIPTALHIAGDGAAWIDAWRAVHPGRAGHTFDPERNALAQENSRTGLPARFDRALLRSHEGRLAVVSAEVRDDLPGAGVLSDHYALRVTLEVRHSDAQRAPLVVHTAVVLTPPSGRCAPIQQIRREHDRGVARWMPHITLLYPFVPAAHFAEAEALLARALQQVEAFRVTLDGFGRFEHAGSTVVWLRCADEAPVQALQAALTAPLPQCAAEIARHGGFTPHLTVARFRREGGRTRSRGGMSLREHLDAWEASWRPLSFWASEVTLISRQRDEPFSIARRLSLGGDAALTGALENADALPSPEDEALVARALRRVEVDVRAIDPDARVLHIGSLAQGARLCGGDLDLLCITTGDAPALLAGLAARWQDASAAQGALPITRVQLASDARTPALRAVLGGLEVDVLAAHVTPLLHEALPHAVTPEDLGDLTPTDRRSVEGALLAQALTDRMHAIGAAETFATVSRALKLLATRRGVKGAAWGCWSGVTWAIAAAWGCQELWSRLEDPGAHEWSARHTLTHTLERLAAWPWPAPLSLTPTAAPTLAEHARMPVLSPLAPFEDTARFMTRSTAHTLRAELQRAAAIAQRALASRASWAELFDARDRGHTPRLDLTLSAPTPDALAAAQGWLHGHVLKLLVTLERDGDLIARPDTRAHTLGHDLRHAIDLPADLSHAARARAQDAALTLMLDFEGWPQRPQGATLDVALA